MKAKIRKMVTIVEEIRIDGGRVIQGKPVQKAAAIAVIANPFTGQFSEDLTILTDIGEELGALLGESAVRALGCNPSLVESYGKAAIVGTDGESEHAAAILHPKLGTPLRQAVGGGKALIPSSKKVGGPGASIDIPLHYKDEAFVRSHFDAMEVRVQEAPRADEILVAIAVTTSWSSACPHRWSEVGRSQKGGRLAMKPQQGLRIRRKVCPAGPVSGWHFLF